MRFAKTQSWTLLRRAPPPMVRWVLRQGGHFGWARTGRSSIQSMRPTLRRARTTSQNGNPATCASPHPVNTYAPVRVQNMAEIANVAVLITARPSPGKWVTAKNPRSHPQPALAHYHQGLTGTGAGFSEPPEHSAAHTIPAVAASPKPRSNKGGPGSTGGAAAASL
jgi:hypothetical protein